MGTNFYFTTKCKDLARQFIDAELSDQPEWHYEIHLAKTSYGWLPLFQAHTNTIESVQALKKFYEEHKENLSIEDEYGDTYTWDAFDKRVLQFNGGVAGKIPTTPIDPSATDPLAPLSDPRLPDHVPISHFEYKMTPEERRSFFKDPEGYEFTYANFC